MQLFSSVNCSTTRVNIIVLSVILQPKTKRCWGCVKWGCRALLCDINQLFMPMKLQNIYLASWYTRPRPQKTNRRLYQRRTGVNSGVERQCATTRGRWWRLVREVWEKPVIDWTSNVEHISRCLTAHMHFLALTSHRGKREAEHRSWSNAHITSEIPFTVVELRCDLSKTYI